MVAGPAFLGIGAQKSGTSWLHRQLSDHPQVWLPPEKELHFFDSRIHGSPPLWKRVGGKTDESVRWRRQVRRQLRRLRDRSASRREAGWYARFFLGAPTPQWYLGLFPDDGRVAGEFTPDYGIVADPMVARARELLADDLRLLLVVRNPIERLWSHAKMEERLLGGDVRLVVEEMVDRDRARRHTDYAGIVDRWTAHFPPSQLWLGFMEDIAMVPEAVLDSVCSFLGIAPLADWPGARRVVHQGGHAQMPVEVAIHLAEVFRDEVDHLAETWGGPTRWWQFTVQQLLEDPPTGSLAYPLWESELWQRWLDAGNPPITAPHGGPVTDIHPIG